MIDEPAPNDPAQKPPLRVGVHSLPDPAKRTLRVVVTTMDPIETVTPRGRVASGSGPNAADTVMFSVRLPHNLVRRIEAFQAERQAQIQGGALTRADAVRMILEQGLSDPEQAPSDPQ
jgi:hypothetical protein